jgi:hypothetical protein
MSRLKFALRPWHPKALPVKTTLAVVVATGLVVLALGAGWNLVTAKMEPSSPQVTSIRSGDINIESTRLELEQLANVLATADNKSDLRLLGRVFSDTWVIAQRITQHPEALQKGTGLYNCSLAVDAVFRGVKVVESGGQWNDQQFRAAIAECR